MATRNVNRLMRSRSSKPIIQVQLKPAPAEDDDPEVENSSKKRKEIRRNVVEPCSCQQCNRSEKLVECKRCRSKKLCGGCIIKWNSDVVTGDEFVKACPACCNVNVKGEGTNHNNGWIFDSESDNSHHPVAIEALKEWRGNAVGQAAKGILEAVERNYPETFQRVEIPSKPLWLSILRELHLFITRFLETSVGALSEDQLNTLETDLNVFEKLGFNLSWARKRLDMARDLKFGNDTWRVELEVLEKSLACSHKEVEELTQRLETVRLEYANARDARDKKVAEVKQRFGDEYNDVLHGNLGFGILSGY